MGEERVMNEEALWVMTWESQETLGDVRFNKDR